MKTYNVPEIAKDVFWVGIKDWNRRLFDSLIPLPQGTTYNSYLVRGKDKIALIDTVNPGFEAEFGAKVGQLTDLATLDYLIMNHAEPDHAGSIPFVMEIAKKAVLVTSEKGAKMAQIYFRVPESRIKKVKEGDRIELGGKTLEFVDAPWLHWPETMFTYLVEDKVLFSCDFYGTHTAFGTYDDEVPEAVEFAKRYFGEIMMPFRNMGAKGVEKTKKREVTLIAPSHGPVWKNPQRILDVYTKWTAGQTEKKVVIAYVSMWSATEAMVKAMAETLLAEGVEVALFNLVGADIGDLARELVDARAVVLGAPTVLAGMHPLGVYAAYLVKALRPPLTYGVVLSSYGWSGGALKQAGEILGPTGIEVVGAVDVNGPPTDADFAKIAELGKTLAAKIAG
jgi:flavorubredoxin